MNKTTILTKWMVTAAVVFGVFGVKTIAMAHTDCHYGDWSNVSCSSDGYVHQIRTVEGHDCDEPLERDIRNANCACKYSSWSGDECTSDGYIHQTRTANYPYCTDNLQRDKSADDCKCSAAKAFSLWADTQCVSEGLMHQTRTQNYSYCDGPVEQDMQKNKCDCSYSAWKNDGCSGDGKMHQIKTLRTDYSYCAVSLEQDVDKKSCACITTDIAGKCASDGFRTHAISYNFGYCGAIHDAFVADPSCACAETATKNCTGSNISQTTYSYNFDYCASKPVLTDDNDTSCLSAYNCGAWINGACVSDGMVAQTQSCTDQYNNTITNTRNFAEPACACNAGKTGSECFGDGKANVSYAWDHEYCGQVYAATETNDDCACQYPADWTNTTCSGDGQMHQIKNQTTSFDYCPELEQDVSDRACDQPKTDEIVNPGTGNDAGQGNSNDTGNGTDADNNGGNNGANDANDNAGNTNIPVATHSDNHSSSGDFAPGFGPHATLGRVLGVSTQRLPLDQIEAAINLIRQIIANLAQQVNSL